MKMPPELGGVHQTVNRHSGIMNCAPCLSLWERWLSEDGEGKPGGSALSVTFGDSSPKGRAKRLYPHLGTKMERICIDTLHNALWLPTKRAAFFVYSRYFFSFSRFSLLMGVSGRRHPPQS